ncbi:hypothetical protein OG607_32455 [Streptomyces sp. NBC_01537]|uniref:hypothetical protein n=1 Tax=Streptomyces sp. NBC_01537 TaxID=2903896 RepID=UPI0038646132
MSQRKRVAVLVGFVAALFAGAIATLVMNVPHLAYAARWEGTPGVFVVRSCAQVGEAKGSHTECDGTFRSDDGTTVDPGATISQPLTAGATVPVQLTSGGGYVLVGVASFCGWLTMVLFGLTLTACAVTAALAATGRTLFRAAWPAVLSVPAAAALASALVGAIAEAVT